MSKITISKKDFFELSDGRTADLYLLENENGMKVEITNYGGIIVRLFVPDRDGNIDDVVLGYDDFEKYLTDQNCFGAVVGPYANRIAAGNFNLDGKNYQLETNEKSNSDSRTLHSASAGFNKKLWTAEEVELKNEKAIKLTYLSKDGKAGFPGNLKVTVYYSLTEDNTLRVEYRAETDQPTIINLTQHSYFNLKGHGKSTIEDHLLYLNADYFTPINSSMIPTGEIKEVKDTAFDFTVIKEISENIDDNLKQLNLAGGYDHNWILNKEENNLECAARVIETQNGRQLEVWTTEPGIQFYTGNGISTNGAAKDKQIYKKRSGFCLETQHYPDSPNHENFPSTILRPGEKFETITEFKFDII